MLALFWASLTSRGVKRRTSERGLNRELLDSSTGENLKQRCPCCARKPAVLAQFSPLMSSITADSDQASKVGTTKSTPFAGTRGLERENMLAPLCLKY